MASDAGDRYTPEEWDAHCADQEAEEDTIRANAVCMMCRYHAYLEHAEPSKSHVCAYDIVTEDGLLIYQLKEDSTPITENCWEWRIRNDI